jgi:hypothetical protein
MAINPETLFSGKINPADSNYPLGSARNVTVSGDGTGTPFVADLVNDSFGFQQAILGAAGFTPTGNPDTARESQYLDGILAIVGAAIFNNVADMKTNLRSSSEDKTVSTQGYYARGGGGQSSYLVKTAAQASSNGDVIDGYGNHTADNGLVLILQIDKIVNILKYGAKGDDQTDNKDQLLAAQAYLAAAGGGVFYVPSGTFRTSLAIPLSSNMTVKGDGYASCIKSIYNAENDIGNPCFQYVNPLRPAIGITDVVFRDMRIEGIWDEVYRELNSNSQLILVGCDGFTMNRCWVKNAEFGSIVLNQCRNAHVHGNWFINSARDMCRLWNTDNSSVIGNTFLRNDDDCISINMAGFENVVAGRPRQGIIVQGNYLQDTGSIRIQSAKNCVIDGNVIKLNKGGFAISLEGVTTAEVRESNVHSCIISNNTILDTIERLLAREQYDSVFSNLRVGIRALSGAWTKDSSDLDSTYEYFNTDTGPSGSLPQRVNSGVLIEGNIVKRTLPAVDNYSDWGYGKMFSRFKDTEVVPGYIVDGEADPVILDQHLSARSLEIRDGLQQSLIVDNTFDGTGQEGVKFRVGRLTKADFHYRDLVFKNNIIRDFRKVGVDLDSDYNDTVQDITFEDNNFNGDPYFKNTDRDGFGGTLTGGWTTLGDCRGINSTRLRGLTVTRNTFSNVSLSYSFGSTKNQNLILNNFIVGEPSSDPDISPTSFSTSHKGVGLYPGDMDYEATLVYTDSDPLSATYSEKLVQQFKSVEFNPPSSGYYFRGQNIVARNSSVTDGNILFGYRRATYGTGHVLNVDWVPLRLGGSVSPPSETWTTTGETLTPPAGFSQITGVIYVDSGGAFQYLLDNDTPEKIYQYNDYAITANVIEDRSGRTLVYDIDYDLATGNRWITGDGGIVVELNSSFVATGRQINASSGTQASANDSAAIYTVVSNGVVRKWNKSTLTEETGFSVDLSSIVGFSASGTSFYYVLSDGRVYTSANTGGTVTLVLESGLSATGIDIHDASLMLISTATQAVEYTNV